ncbi:MAG: orotidine-5'-phosphate decarboxylase [Candidatus Omnitrophica bacterium]|nr:orotidine-5'-phosphate decarboxylase [Candidatus Omnitrophota bacterium]MCB9747180.1 orotidine-5'-phosphate decarboxylase [Candidatus Omnitrophota bacterium]
MKKNTKAQLIVALDVDTFEEAKKLVDQLSSDVEIFKVGSQLFTSCGPMAVRYILAQGRKVFLDLKFHDIPNTVASAVRCAVGLGVTVIDTAAKTHHLKKEEMCVFMCTVHVVGGEEMLKSSVEEATKQAQNIGVIKPLIVGITVLTSEAKTDNIHQTVVNRAVMAKQAGLDGVVASSQEAALIRKELGEDFIIVTPGIRPSGVSAGDQKRITTPKEAINNGSDFLVVGRPIVQEADPLKAAKKILAEIQ